MVRRCGSSLPRGAVGRKRDGRHPLGVLPFLRRRPQQSMPLLLRAATGGLVVLTFRRGRLVTQMAASSALLSASLGSSKRCALSRFGSGCRDRLLMTSP
jgi:hypothetical protein